MSKNEITYYPILGKVRTYSWNDVRKVRYASGGRGSKGRIIIVTDKTISIEKDMKQDNNLKMVVDSVKNLITSSDNNK